MSIWSGVVVAVLCIASAAVGWYLGYSAGETEERQRQEHHRREWERRNKS